MDIKSAIKAMYFMERGTFDKIGYSKSYDEALQNSGFFDDELKRKLKNRKELLDLYKKTDEAHQRLCSENAYLHFAEGFRFGVLMGLDVAGYIKDENIFDD